MKEEIAIFRFRRDLRIEDNAGLLHTLTSGYKVLPLFICDTNILSFLEHDDLRMSFLGGILENLNSSIKKRGSSLQVFTGKTIDVFRELQGKYKIKALYFNRDYEPYALKRDKEITEYLHEYGIQCFSYKDQVIFEKSEIVKNDGNPYTSFTPYSIKWLSKFRPGMITTCNSEKLAGNFAFIEEELFIKPIQLGFSSSHIEVLSPDLEPSHIAKYGKMKDFPSESGTSFLGPHLRFGTISIRKVLRRTADVRHMISFECNSL